MLLCQTLSMRISLSTHAFVTIEYFPLKILLYNFRIRKKRKRKLIKQTKKLLFFLSPIYKSLIFLTKKSDVKIYNISLSELKSTEPHSYFLYRKIISLSEAYIYSLLYAISKSAHAVNNESVSEDNGTAIIDFEITTRLYNVFLATAVLTFYSIKKKGIKKIV